jgi:hypothetical protein
MKQMKSPLLAVTALLWLFPHSPLPSQRFQTPRLQPRTPGHGIRPFRCTRRPAAHPHQPISIRIADIEARRGRPTARSRRFGAVKAGPNRHLATSTFAQPMRRPPWDCRPPRDRGRASLAEQQNPRAKAVLATGRRLPRHRGQLSSAPRDGEQRRSGGVVVRACERLGGRHRRRRPRNERYLATTATATFGSSSQTESWRGNYRRDGGARQNA